jgi:cell wall-associated NlpC family hydrolase
MWWERYIGIPFKQKGRDLTGFDCWGLICDVYLTELSIKLPDYLNSYSDTSKDFVEISSIMGSEKERIAFPVTSPKAFDVILLRMRGLPMHVGLVTRENFMIHCADGVGVSFEDYTSPRWKSRVMGFYRYAGE